MNYSAAEIIAISEFLGSACTQQQAEELADLCRELSIEDKEKVLANCSGALYTEVSMMAGECGGFHRY